MKPAVLIAALLLSGWAHLSASAATSMPAMSVDVVSQLPSLIQQADVIVTAKVVGMVDSAPDASQRKAREVHRISVQTTLQGFDETGRTLLVNPRGLLLTDGESYVFFLRRREGNFLEALGSQLVGASERNLAFVRKEVAARGHRVRPARVLWMTYSGGWQKEPAVEFFVDVQGRYEWTAREANQKHVGTLPEPVVKDVLRKVREADKGPIVDDAGMISFHWVEQTGDVVTKTFHSPGKGPGAELLAIVADLARRHGTTGQNPP